jgi:pimeloyl-ACP methyl ester carboxylesterase
LRYDKRGVAESRKSGKSELDLRFEDYINDAKGWIDFLLANKQFSKIIVIGHSEGSLIGMIAAEDRASFISIAGAGRSADLILKEQLAAQPKQILESALYALMRYQAASYIKLNIVVPGNVGVTVGDVIEIELPAANESNKSLPIESTYSGYYLVLGVVHVWRPEGVTTNIDIGRDSVKKY